MIDKSKYSKFGLRLQYALRQGLDPHENALKSKMSKQEIYQQRF